MPEKFKEFVAAFTAVILFQEQDGTKSKWYFWRML